ncbi:MAG: hypothetical protein ACLR0U_27240 [Enterocloster clostridioformis]
MAAVRRKAETRPAGPWDRPRFQGIGLTEAEFRPQAGERSRVHRRRRARPAGIRAAALADAHTAGPMQGEDPGAVKAGIALEERGRSTAGAAREAAAADPGRGSG